MNLLYLGSLTSYLTQNDLRVFRDLGYTVTVLNPYPITGNPPGGLIEFDNAVNLYDQKRLGTLYATIGGTLTSVLLSVLKRKMDVIRKITNNRQIEAIYAAWGSNMIPLIRMIQKEKLSIPTVYDFLTYPQNLFKWKVTLENLYCKGSIESIDARIHCSRNMYEYMRSRFDLKKQGRDIILPKFFSKSYFYNKRLPLLSDADGEPHVVFIGPTSFSLPWDDIRQDVYGISREKIHFHLVHTNAPMERNPYIHFFKYFPLKEIIKGSLANFMTQFDACIILFNFNRGWCINRFHTSLPSRFLFALNAGIPIIMPRGYLLACEEFVNKHQIGFSYKNPKHLKEILSDDTLIRKYRKNAVEKAFNFTCEKNFHKLDKLIRAVARASAMIVDKEYRKLLSLKLQ